jgi:tRNA dimethylallyltransferase
MVSTKSSATPRVGILSGSTGAGKTAVALEWARRSRGQLEIISADSVQVYRGADIGSDKISTEIRNEIPHHGIDTTDPDQPYTAGDFVRMANAAIDEIHARGKRALIVGGTGFYLKALIYGMWDLPGPQPTAEEKTKLRAVLEARPSEDLFAELTRVDPVWAEKIMAHDRYRMLRGLEIWHLHHTKPSKLDADAARSADPRFELWVIDRPTDDLKAKLRNRVRAMLDQGFEHEVRSLVAQFPESPLWRFAGYRQVHDFLAGKRPPGRKPRPGLLGLEDEIVLAHEQLTKAQRTWFRSEKLSQPFELDRDRMGLDDAFQRVYGF